ncbi:MAG TPA: NAD-dependent epimerase/dehydratase family protein [Acidimicrobiales bacterium]|nr:NAD-dependent epimerase/dehydratase family protein [Acidimicrobiales bacterium]
MGKIVVSGVESPLGRRVAGLLADLPDAEVVGLAGGPVVGLPDGVAVRRVDLAADDVKPHVEHAEAVVHLVSSEPATPAAATDDVVAARRVLDAAGDAGAAHLVVLSSATVYGAWPDNPVPLTEAATLRPNPGFPFAAERAEIERLTAEWREAHPGATAAVLRPARAAGPDHRDWLVRALRPGPATPGDGEEPPVQFVALDDLAAAVEVAVRERLDGAYNVAPEGSVPGEEVRALVGAPPKVPLPTRLVRWALRSGLGPTPPGLVPYALHPWVVASDRLRARGWQPAVTNEEACVEAHEVGAWATLSPQRRQEIALGVAGAGIVAAIAAAVVVVRRALRGR